MTKSFAVVFGIVFVVPMLFGNGLALADKAGKRCTKTSTSCYDTVNHQARTCVTETCTYKDGTSTTSTTVELQGGGGSTGGGKTIKPIEKVPNGATMKQQ